jgi:hypothetical protein
VRPARTVLAAAAGGLCLLMGACGQPGAVPAGGQEPGSGASAVPAVNAPVTWADGYCGAVSELVKSLSTMPSIDPSSPQQATRTSSDLLDAVVAGLNRTLDGLSGLGPSPVPGGDQVRADAVTSFTGLRDSATAAKARIDERSSDPAEIKGALAGAGAQLDAIAKIKFLAPLDAVPALADAARQAPSCRLLSPT